MSKAITLIGSMKFWDTFLETAEKLHREGNIVFLPIKDTSDNISEETMAVYDKLIREMIFSSDEVLVINVNKYIGKSTRSEINYAIENDIPVTYLEDGSLKITTLCGSRKFQREFTEVFRDRTLRGEIVLTPTIFEFTEIQVEKMTEDEHNLQDNIHFTKIDMSDLVFIINPCGYIGEDTRKEIEYAKSIGKKIEYLEPIKEEN